MMPQPIRILLFTGDPPMINAVANALKTSQIACLLEIAPNHEAFSCQLETSTPDIILTHDAAPYYDGFAQLRAIKAAVPAVPVIFVTRSQQNEAHAIEAIQAGAEDYLSQDRLFLLPIAILKAAEKKKLLEEKARAEEALRASEARYRQIVELTPEHDIQVQHAILQGILESSHALIFSIDTQYRYTSFNKRHAAMMQALYGSQIRLGGSLLEAMPTTEDREKARRNLARALQGEFVEEESVSGDEQHSRRYFGVSHYPIRDENGMVIGAAVFTRDITERKQAEMDLVASEEHYRLAIRAAQAIPYSRDYDSETYTFVSPEIQVLTGYSADEFTPAVMDLLIEEAIMEGEYSGQSLSESVQRVRHGDGGPLWVCTYRLHTRTGEMRWVKDSSVQVLDERGRPKGSVGILQDITERKQIEDVLRESNERFTQIMAHLPEVVWMYEYQQQKILYASPAYEQVYQASIADLYQDSRHYFDRIHPDDRQIVFAAVEGQKEGKQSAIEYRVVRTDGSVRWIYDQAFPIRGDTGEVIRATGIATDITERKQIEASLLMFHQAIDAASNGIAITDPNQPDNPLIYVNSAFEQLTGYPREAILGRNCRFLHGNDTAQPGLEVIREAVRKECGCKAVLRNYRQNGEPFDIELTISPVRDAAGRLLYFIGVQQDITEQKKAAAALQASEQRFRSTFENAHIGIAVTNLDGYFLKVNQRLAEMFGYALAEFEQKHINDFTHPDYLDISPRFIQEAMSGKAQRGEFEKAYLHRDGHVVWGRVSSTLERDEEGQPLYFISHILDVTRQKEAEKALLEKLELEQRLAQITQTAPGGLCSFCQRADGTICMPYVSPVWEELLDLQAVDVCDDASIIFQRIHPDDLPHFVQTIQTSADTMSDWRDEFRILNPVKGEIWVEGHSAPTRQSDGSLLWNGFITDITARKRAELALQQLNQELEQRIAERTAELEDLYDNAPCGYHSLDANGVFIRINQTELNWLGYQREEIVGQKHFPDLLSPASRQTFLTNFPRFKAQGWIADLEFEMLRKDGSLLPVLLNATAVYDAAGNYMISRSTLIDYTERKLAEQERERARDAANAANHAKSEFLANMSHELRTPLNSILGYAQILQKADNLHERQREGVRTIRESGEHLLTLITDILDMSKIEAGRMDVQMSEFHLAEFLKRIAQMIRVRTEQKRLSFVLTVAPNVPDYTAADERKFRQVLVNLLGNAIKFTEQGRISLSVTVSTPNLSPKERGASSPLSFGEGAGVRSEKFAALPSQNQNIWLRFEVADTGVGIAPDDLPKLFVPFRQVGARYAAEGTGLGLAISAKFVGLMGGELHVESEPGRGSRFWFDLPTQVLAQVETPAAAPPDLSGEVAGYAGTRRIILTIDDKAANRAILVNMLEPLGFQMLETDNGFSGLELAFSRHPDLILLDLRMPDMDGFEVARRLRAHPAGQTCKIIAVSASVQGDIRQQCLAAGCDEFLSKPVIFEELQRVLTAQLGVTWLTTEQAQANREPAQTDLAASALALPPDLAAQLRDKAERGDIRAVTRLLDQLAERDPRYAPFVEQLRNLAKNFQVDEIAKILRDPET